MPDKEKPKFDPNKPFTVVKEKPKFDPNKPFTVVDDKSSSLEGSGDPLKKKVSTQPSQNGAGKPQTSMQALLSGFQKSQSTDASSLNATSRDLGMGQQNPLTSITAPLRATKEQTIPIGQLEPSIEKKRTQGDPKSIRDDGNGISTPSSVAFEGGGIDPAQFSGIQGGTKEEIAENIKKFETVNLQKDLKSKGHEIDVTGIEDEKTKFALNLDRDQVKLIEKEAFEEADFFNSVNNLLTKDKSLYSEEKLVPYLEDKFGNQGFEFQETGFGTNTIIATSIPDGVDELRSITVDVSEEGISELSEFLKQARLTATEKGLRNPGGGIFPENYDSLTPEEQAPYNERYQNKMTELMVSNPYKYGKKLIDDEYFTNIVNDRTLDLRVALQEFEVVKEQLASLREEFNSNQTEEGMAVVNEEIKKAIRLEKTLIEKNERLNELQKNYQKATGMYAAEKEKKGNFIGMVTGGLYKGLTSLERKVASLSMDVMPTILGTDAVIDPFTNSKLDQLGYTESEKKDYVSKELKRYFIPKIEEGIQDIATGGSTTKEYGQSKDRTEIEKVINFLTESVGAAAAGGGSGAFTKLSFFAMSSNAIDEEMRGTDFDGLTESEKLLISVPYALTIGALEKLGFKISTGVGGNAAINKLTKSIIARTFSSLPKNASIEVIEQAIKKNALAVVADSGLKLVAGASVEGLTEGLQQIADVSIKNISNAITEKDYFQHVPDITTKEGVKETISLALEDAKYGFYGGLVMSGGGMAVKAVKGKIKDNQFEFFMENMMDQKLLDISFNEVKAKFDKGEITREQAEDQFKAMDKAKATIESIPADLSVNDKRRSFDLINEKESINQEIEGKDKGLVKSKLERIKEIDATLEAIGSKDSKIEGVETKKPVSNEDKISSKKDEIALLKAKNAASEEAGELPVDENGDILDVGTEIKRLEGEIKVLEETTKGTETEEGVEGKKKEFKLGKSDGFKEILGEEEGGEKGEGTESIAPVVKEIEGSEAKYQDPDGGFYKDKEILKMSKD